MTNVFGYYCGDIYWCGYTGMNDQCNLCVNCDPYGYYLKRRGTPMPEYFWANYIPGIYAINNNIFDYKSQSWIHNPNKKEITFKIVWKQRQTSSKLLSVINNCCFFCKKSKDENGICRPCKEEDEKEEEEEEDEDIPFCDYKYCENTENLKKAIGWNRYEQKFMEQMFCPDCYDMSSNTDCYYCGKSIPNGKEVVLSADGNFSCIPCYVLYRCCPKGHFGGQYGCDFCESQYELKSFLRENKEVFKGKYCAEKHYRMLKCS